MNNSPSYHHHHHKSKNNKEEEEEEESLGSTIYKCGFCHKTFNSAKALSSHKKSHHTTFNHVLQQPQTNNQNRILKITWFSSSGRNKDNNDGKQQHKKPYLCRVCDKVFSSNKALNGHMRWHTQKGSKKGSASSLLEQNKRSNYDHQDRLSAKRTKRFVIDDDVCNAAQSLLDMSRGKFLNFDVDDHPYYC